jgi:hypothetical protein
MSRRKLAFLAIKFPWLVFILDTPLPELFGFTEATSKAGRAAPVAGTSVGTCAEDANPPIRKIAKNLGATGWPPKFLVSPLAKGVKKNRPHWQQVEKTVTYMYIGLIPVGKRRYRRSGQGWPRNGLFHA